VQHWFGAGRRLGGNSCRRCLCAGSDAARFVIFDCCLTGWLLTACVHRPPSLQRRHTHQPCDVAMPLHTPLTLNSSCHAPSRAVGQTSQHSCTPNTDRLQASSCCRGAGTCNRQALSNEDRRRSLSGRPNTQNHVPNSMLSAARHYNSEAD
jgi:hypothetical protein